jgi:thiol-disulfide isomerase/thioredoxin
MSNLIDITSDQQFTDVTAKKEAVYVLNFWASWAEPCQQMNEVFTELAGKFPALHFLKVREKGQEKEP